MSTENCEKYIPGEDYCKQCVEGYYLTNDKTCEAYPTGIVECTHYEKEDTCTRCSKNYYLKDNVCNLVPLVDRIPNCNLYKDKTTCQRCAQSYFLKIDSKTFATACKMATALNCVNYEEASNGSRCSKCQKGYGF